MIPPTQPTPHVIMMRSLLEMAIPLRINPTYANVITLLQKVSLYVYLMTYYVESEFICILFYDSLCLLVVGFRGFIGGNESAS